MFSTTTTSTLVKVSKTSLPVVAAAVRLDNVTNRIDARIETPPRTHIIACE